MEQKEISIIVIYKGYIPENADLDSIESQVKQALGSDYFRLQFKEKEGEEYNEDYHEPFFSEESLIIAENGFQIIT